MRALTAFEAAARLGSFRLAAAELGITRSAVSHQVKALEQHLSLQLFKRDARRAELTQAGHAYFPPVRDAFDQIEAQTRNLRPAVADNELTIQVYVTVALKWLIPRLHDFERRYPDMKVKLSTAYFDWEFDETNVDCGIRARTQQVARPPLPPAVPLAADTRLLARPAQGGECASRPRPTSRSTSCFMSIPPRRTGASGSKRAGVKDIELSDRLAFDSYILAQEAAIEGRGLAMTIGPFATDEIRMGRLVQPFSLLVPHRHRWQFACKAEDKLKPKIKRFEEWLVKQVAADPNLAPYR